jgi:sugar lactone lactonase YvrE
MQAHVLYRCEDEIGEAATWLPRRNMFLWVDIDNRLLHEYHPETHRIIDHVFPDRITAIIPVEGTDENEVWLAMKDRLVSYHLKTGVRRELLTLFSGMPGFRTNDGKLSPEGRIWIGVMHMKNHHETGALYCVESDFSCRKVLDRQCIPNGMAWNREGDKMYYADSGRGCIYRFAYDCRRGAIRSRQTAVEVPAEYGVPDGMAIDEDGLLWVAHWGGFGVYVWDPETGRLVDKIEVPVPLAASCAFGGEKRDVLYITTARSGLTEAERARYPSSGSLFSVKIK